LSGVLAGEPGALVGSTNNARVIGSQVVSRVDTRDTNSGTGASQAVSGASNAAASVGIDEVAVLTSSAGEIVGAVLLAGSTTIGSVITTYAGPVSANVIWSATVVADHTSDDYA